MKPKLLTYGFSLPGQEVTVTAPLPAGLSYNLSVLARGAKVEVKKVDGDRVTLANTGDRATPFILTAITEQTAAVLRGVGTIISAVGKKEPPT